MNLSLRRPTEPVRPQGGAVEHVSAAGTSTGSDSSRKMMNDMSSEQNLVSYTGCTQV